MKKIKLFLILSLVGLLFFSCSSKQKEETKMIPSSAVKKSGKNSDILTIKGDSVKVMLVKISENKWTLRALIPIENAIPNTDPSATPSMGNLSVVFLDANGSPIDFELRPDWDAVESVLSSNSFKTEDLLVKEAYENLTPGKFDKIKEKFDKIAGIALKGLELSYTYKNDGSSHSSSSSYSSGNDNQDDVSLDDAVTAAKAATEVLKATGEVVKSTGEVVKSTKGMYKEAKKAEKQLKKLEEDDDDWGW